MNRFDYIRPSSVAEAIEAAIPGSALLAGGTNLVDLMKAGVARPTRVVDITRLPGLDRIEWLGDGGVRIGALVRNSDLAHDSRFARAFPAVAEAVLSGASPQLRNAARLGGNLMQRTRCAYFLDTASACNRRRPGSGCDARDGENRQLAVLGWSEHCIATHPSDVCVPLVALDAMVEVAGPNGVRDFPLDGLHRLPNATPEHETNLAPGEIIVGLRIPGDAVRYRDHSRYLKLRERTSFAFALVSAAAALEFDGDRIRSARVALGGVAAKPWRALDAENVLSGATISEESFYRAAAAALAGAAPSGDNEFKIELARRLVQRALLVAAAGTPDVMPALPASPFSVEMRVGESHVA